MKCFLLKATFFDIYYQGDFPSSVFLNSLSDDVVS